MLQKRVETSAHQEKTARILDELLDAYEKLHCFETIDQPVIVNKGKVHNGADQDLSVQRNRKFLNLVQPKHSKQRVIQYRRAHEGPEDAAIRDRECTA